VILSHNIYTPPTHFIYSKTHPTLMDPLTIVGYIISILIVAVPIAYTYSKKLGLALSIIYELMNVVSSYMNGDIDHVFTDAEKIDLADKVIVVAKRINDNVKIDAVLNYKE
jgi:hypothetical protein